MPAGGLTLDLQDLNNIIINQMTLFAIQPSSLIIDQLATTARMTEITDELMRQMISRAKNYYIVILKAGPNRNKSGVEEILWEHARMNFALRDEGLLPIVCPVSDGSGVSGIGIFNASIDEVKRIMDEDPGVKEGIFVYEIHAGRSFPEDCLPE